MLKSLTPGPSSGVPINSTPAFVNTSNNLVKVDMWPFGIPSAASSLLRVDVPILEFSDKSANDHFKRARAALSCALVNNLFWTYNGLK